MLIVIPIFEGITALDAVGPYEILSRLPGADVTFAAVNPGVYRTDRGSLGLQADKPLADIPACDVVCVPGGPGQAKAAGDQALLEWLRDMDACCTWTTSVCTGSLLLGAAGVLRGRRAVTHWLSMDLLASFGALPQSERIVADGKYVTAAGVSAGIDMALWLAAQIAGQTVAEAIQLSVEYAPEPPFTSGSPQQARPEVVRLVRAVAARQQGPVD